MKSHEKSAAESAIVAYFARIEAGTATPEEIQILPTMLERFRGTEPPAEEPRATPEVGLISPDEVAVMLGRRKMKKPCVMLIKKVKEEGFPAPFRWERPYRWLAQEVRAYIEHERSVRASR